MTRIAIIIPALNEAGSIGTVLKGITKVEGQEIIVVDGGSSDLTVETARSCGADVIIEPRKGYGLACEAGLKHASGKVLVFMDADGANDPDQLSALVEPVIAGRADMVLGSRLAGTVARGAMPWHQHFGNWFSAHLIYLLYGFPLTDLSPFRAVRRSRLLQLDIEDKTYGWPTEMILKAIRLGWHIEEIPVNYLPRIAGESKISGTLYGTFLAARHILSVILKNWKSG